MRLRHVLYAVPFVALIFSLPAEAAGMSESSTISIVAMVLGVAVLACLMKRFMR